MSRRYLFSIIAFFSKEPIAKSRVVANLTALNILKTSSLKTVSASFIVWISFLSKNHQYTPGERLTVAVLYRLIYIYKYYDYGIIKDILEYNHYHVQMHDGDPIICVIPLLPEKISDIYAKNIIHGNKEAMIRWNFIRNLCKEIKKINPSLILAVIPQVNRMSFMCKTGKINCQIHDLPPIYDSLCIFIKNTPEGQNLIRNFPISHSALERKRKK